MALSILAHTATAQEEAAPDEGEHPAEEARAARPARDPGAPTQADRDAHSTTHLPFRSWCNECVQGRKDAPAHYRTKRGAGEVPEVSFDYAFIRRDTEEEVATLLVMRDRDSKSIRAWALEHKGVDMAETVNRAVAGIQQLGYRGRVLIRTDGEGALKALRNAITAALPDGATPISTPVGESASNGIIEGAVKIVKGLLRVHLLALERKIGATFPAKHPVLAWLVEHVSDIISKYMVGLDGKTGYERLFGRPVREEGLEFGETLHWKHRATQDMNVVLDARWSSGVWLGRRWGGVVHQVFANGKVHEIRGIQRQPRDARWRKESIEAITATPWDREPAAEGELRILPPLAPPAAAAAAEEPEVREQEYNPHRVFIKQADLETFGFTEQCRRCQLMRRRAKAQGIKHTDEPETADDGKPYTVVGYLNGVGSVLKQEGNDYTGSRPELTQDAALDRDYIQQALIPMSSETHSGEDVAVFAKGPWAHLFDGMVEQNYIFHVMNYATNAGQAQ